jgi:hypothetical protein
MSEELTPREIILQDKEDFIIIAQELLKEGLSSENLGLYDDLMWEIQSIEASLDCPNMDEFTMFWVIGREGFLRCPLRTTRKSGEERSCAEVDCPRFNTCKLTKGILDKCM